jgi:hypothetical protein
MSDNTTTRWTIRLTDEDKRTLEALCKSHGLKRPDAVRRALREALASTQVPQTIMLSGSFVPLSSDRQTVFPIQLRRKATNE